MSTNINSIEVDNYQLSIMMLLNTKKAWIQLPALKKLSEDLGLLKGIYRVSVTYNSTFNAVMYSIEDDNKN